MHQYEQHGDGAQGVDAREARGMHVDGGRVGDAARLRDATASVRATSAGARPSRSLLLVRVAEHRLHVHHWRAIDRFDRTDP